MPADSSETPKAGEAGGSSIPLSQLTKLGILGRKIRKGFNLKSIEGFFHGILTISEL